METLIEHVTEPEVALPPPRRARLPGSMTLLLLLAYLLLGLFAAGSSRGLWEAGKILWLGHAGQTVMGQIAEIQWEPSAAKAQPPQQAAIRYAVNVPDGNGGSHHRSGWIGLGQGKNEVRLSMRQYQLGQPVPVRYAPWFGGVASMPWQPVPRGRLMTLALSSSLVLMVSLLLIWRIARWSASRLRLLRNGVATTGTIIHKRSEAGDMTNYYLLYGYAPLLDAGREREEQVSREQWQRFEVGQPVTVLFDPDEPQQAGLYALMRQ